MLSVPDFIQSIQSETPAYDVTHNFGKMMVLYRLLGGMSDLAIATTHAETTAFRITAKSASVAADVDQYIGGNRYTVYGNKYDIRTERSRRVINVNIVKVTEEGA